MFDKKKSAFFGSIQGMKKMDPLDRSDSSEENCYNRTPPSEIFLDQCMVAVNTETTAIQL